MRYLLFWDIWSADPGMRAYFKLKDHQIIGTPHGATILDRIIKNEEANQPPPRQIMDETAQKQKCTILPSSFVVWRGGGINVLSISYKHRRQPGKILNIKYLRLH